jgi:dihydrolipoamide dehydrogenase
MSEITKEICCDVVVLGAGPGGYTAAFRASDLGLKTVLVNDFATLGGVCLNVGCIPSKTLLHAAEVVNTIKHSKNLGISVSKLSIDFKKLKDHKNKIIEKLTAGLSHLAKQRKVEIITGYGRFLSCNDIIVKNTDGSETKINFKNAIIAVGSSINKNLVHMPASKNIIYSTEGLELQDMTNNKQMLIIGGGIIGLEMAEIYASLGVSITVIEKGPQLIPAADADLVKVLHDILVKNHNIKIYTANTINKADVVTYDDQEKILIEFSDDKTGENRKTEFDRVLVAVGRIPNGNKINAQNANVFVDEKGFIPVNSKGQTNIDHIYAIGDVVGNPMLAHKASYEAKIAAANCAGKDLHFDASVIPSIAYTSPEIAWVGMTEKEAKARGIEIKVGKFPWIASGRALANDATEGFTKIIANKANGQIIGGGIVGRNAGELLAEIVLAIETACKIEDITHTIHAHPTLSESVALATEMIEGTITDLYIGKA